MIGRPKPETPTSRTRRGSTTSASGQNKRQSPFRWGRRAVSRGHIPSPRSAACSGGATESIAQKCQCAPALAAQATLAVASLAAQRLADVRMPYGQTRPLSLFLFTVAASGERKSTADNEALIPVRMHEKNLKRDYQTAHEAWRISHAAWAAEHKKIEADRKLDRLSREAELSALGRAPAEPVRPLFTAPEPTVEALAKHWATLPGSLGSSARKAAN